MSKRMSLALALLCAAPIVLAGAGMDIGPGGGGVGGSGDVTAASSLTDNAFVVGDGGSKGVKTISAATARSTLNVEDGATADQAASEFEDGGDTPLALENIAGSANTGDFWVGAASGRATPVSSSTAGAGLANLVNPADHAASHTDGTDDIQSATNAQKGLATAAQIAALEAIDTETLLLDGTRAMTGNLNMGSQAITSVGNVDGRDVSADGTKLDGIESGAQTRITSYIDVWRFSPGSLYPCGTGTGYPAEIDGPAYVGATAEGSFAPLFFLDDSNEDVCASTRDSFQVHPQATQLDLVWLTEDTNWTTGTTTACWELWYGVQGGSYSSWAFEGDYTSAAQTLVSTSATLAALGITAGDWIEVFWARNGDADYPCTGDDAGDVAGDTPIIWVGGGS